MCCNLLYCITGPAVVLVVLICYVLKFVSRDPRCVLSSVFVMSSVVGSRYQSSSYVVVTCIVIVPVVSSAVRYSVLVLCSVKSSVVGRT